MLIYYYSPRDVSCMSMSTNIILVLAVGIPGIEILNKVFQNDEAEPWWRTVIGGDIYEDLTPR